MSKDHTNASPSRRNLLVGSAAIVASASAAAATLKGASATAAHDNKTMHRSNMVATKDGAQIYFKNWAPARTRSFSATAGHSARMPGKIR